MGSYIFAIGSFLAGLICLGLSRTKKYLGNVEKKYGGAAAQRLAKSLKLWGYFLLVASFLLVLALLWEGAPR